MFDPEIQGPETFMNASRLTTVSPLNGSTPLDVQLTTAGAWDVMVRACEAATTSIDFEQYIVRDDVVGRGFLDLLARKAREGVRVRIVLDALGSRSLRQPEIQAALRDAGAKIVFYHERRPGHWVRPLSWIPRTHAKLLHVDGVTYLGSMCMAHYMRSWRDTMVRLSGQLAQAAQADFDSLWSDLDDGRLDGSGGTRETGSLPAYYAAQNPKGGLYPLYEALLAAVDEAQKDIRLVTPYFFPPHRLRNALKAARSRGVRIRLILSHATDVPIADHITTAHLPIWRRMGYEVELYRASVLHAKYAVIDDVWATIGSCNFDYLSLCCNREANLVMTDAAMVAQVKAHFDADLLNCQPASPQDERAGGWLARLRGRIGAALLHQV